MIRRSTLSIRRGIVTGAARLALSLGLALAVISLLPTPSLVQYFCVTVPFVIVLVVCSGIQWLDTLHGDREKRKLLVW